MPDYTRLNLREDVEDLAPRFGYAPHLQSRFARQALGLRESGISYFKVAPGYRVPFGHRHERQEEIYVVITGSARLKLEDEIVELGPFDAIRVPGDVRRGVQAGPAGAEILAFGAPNTEGADVEMLPEFWTE